MILLLMLFSWGVIAHAQDEPESADDEVEAVEEEFDLTDEELDAILTNVDRFFIDQDIASLRVDVDIYRDPSNRLNERNIRSDNPSSIAGLSTIISHYTYEYPEFFELKIMGQVLAGSEVPSDRTFFSQLLPMPGAPIYTDDIRERFRITFESLAELEGTEVYKIRYSALDRDTEFFDYILYFIDVELEVILRVESYFDNGWYVGSGAGEYFYDDFRGKFLPVYGHGSVFFMPNRSYNVWGRWYMWDWQSPEEAGLDESEPEDNAEITDTVDTESAEESLDNTGEDT